MSTYETDQLKEIERCLRQDDAAFVAAFERRAYQVLRPATQPRRRPLARLAGVAALVVALVVLAALADAPALALAAMTVAAVAGWSAVAARRRREATNSAPGVPPRSPWR